MAMVFKKGIETERDSYSAFDGRLSIEHYPFDSSDSRLSLLSQASLADLVATLHIKRLFVVGVATDYCVMNSVLDALGRNPGKTPYSFPSLKQVVCEV